MTIVLGAPPISQSLLADLDRVGRKHRRWTVQAYFELDGNYRVEYCRGNLEILPMPTIEHQRIAQRLNTALVDFVASGHARGEVLFAGARIEVADDLFREPDVLFIPEEWAHQIHKEYAERAGLVIEVVSESNREHDLRTKRDEYARAGIPEYWIADPEAKRITVLGLEAGQYIVRNEAGPGGFVRSTFLPGFAVAVSAVFGLPEAAPQ
jgi:Uma2 family endonuclease